MSLKRSFLVTRWLERDSRDERRKWKQHAGAAAKRRRSSRAFTSTPATREALLHKIMKLANAATENAGQPKTTADHGEDE
jgi:hypothetical protein